MRTLTLKAFAMAALALGAFTFAPAKATADEVRHLEKSLIKVVVDLDAKHDLITVNHINILDYNYVPITDVLDDVNVGVLTGLLNENDIASFNQGVLDDILQFAGVLDQNQIVVGVLSDQGIIYFLDGGL